MAIETPCDRLTQRSSCTSPFLGGTVERLAVRASADAFTRPVIDPTLLRKATTPKRVRVCYSHSLRAIGHPALSPRPAH